MSIHREGQIFQYTGGRPAILDLSWQAGEGGPAIPFYGVASP